MNIKIIIGDEKKKDTMGKTCEEIAEEAEAIWNQ